MNSAQPTTKHLSNGMIRWNGYTIYRTPAQNPTAFACDGPATVKGTLGEVQTKILEWIEGGDVRA